jgi:preprotein translocase subunit SecG
MLTFIIILLVITCILLVFIVLIQNPKGGGLVSEFSATNQIIGVQKQTDTVEKFTWGLVTILFVLCLTSTLLGTKQVSTTTEKESLIKDKVIELPSAPINQQQAPSQMPDKPTPTN